MEVAVIHDGGSIRYNVLTCVQDIALKLVGIFVDVQRYQQLARQTPKHIHDFSNQLHYVPNMN